MNGAIMTTRGRITLPAEACAKLQLGKGSKVDVTVNADGEIILRPVTSDVTSLQRKKT